MKNRKQCCLYMSDAHIKSRTWVNFTGLADDAYTALHKIERADNLPNTLIIGGDWFDNNHPSAFDLAASYAFFARFKKVYYIKGNHDCASAAFLSAANVLSSVPFYELQPISMLPIGDNIWLTGMSYTSSSDKLKQFIKDIIDRAEQTLNLPWRLFIVMHTGMRHLVGFDQSWQLELKDLEELAHGLPVTFLCGHVHTTDLSKLSGSAEFYSAGSLYPVCMTDVGKECGAMVIDVNDGDVRMLDTKVRSYHTLDMTSRDEAVMRITDIVQKNRLLLPPFIKLKVPADKDATGLVVDGAVIRIVSDNEDEDADRASEQIWSQDGYTMQDAVREELSDEDEADLACALLADTDPLGTLMSWFDEWQVAKI